MTMGDALRRTLELVLSSESSLYASDDVEKIAGQLRAAIAALDAGRPVDRATLRTLFAPTGSIQDTSMDNRWGDEFLSLSRIVEITWTSEPLGGAFRG